ncbi:MAG: hypothetical protein ABL308_07825 [Oceanicaulis sp.]
MSRIVTTAALGGIAALVLAVPALTDPPDHAPAHGYRDKTGDYPAEYMERFAGRDFRYFEAACANTEASAAGVILGALLGDTDTGARLGAALSDCDRAQFSTASRIAFDNDDAAFWRNPATGYRGVVHAGAPIQGYGDQSCRRADAEFFSPEGDYVSETLTLCRTPDGGWEPID